MSASKPVVLQLVNSFAIGGAESLAGAVAARLPELGFESHICGLLDYGDPESCAIHTDRLQAAGVSIHELRKPRFGPDTAALLRLRRLVRGIGAEIVHSHCISPDLHAALALVGVGRCPLVRTLHSTEYAHVGWMRRLEKTLRWRFARTLAVSVGVRTWALEQGMDPRSLVLLENGVDVAAIDGAATLEREALVPGIAPEEPLLVSVGRMDADEAKGFPDLLEALAILRSRGAAFRALLVGEGVMRPAYEARARELGLKGRAVFLGRRHDVPSILKASDMFVLASRREGLPLVDCEAGATGLPVVATRIPGHADVIDDGVDGVLVPARDPAAFADAVAALLADRERGRALAAALRRKVVERFSLERTVREQAALYRELVAVR